MKKRNQETQVNTPNEMPQVDRPEIVETTPHPDIPQPQGNDISPLDKV